MAGGHLNEGENLSEKCASHQMAVQIEASQTGLSVANYLPNIHLQLN